MSSIMRLLSSDTILCAGRCHFLPRRHLFVYCGRSFRGQVRVRVRVQGRVRFRLIVRVRSRVGPGVRIRP